MLQCSYNRVRNVYACENPATLRAGLKSALGFRGFVVSDWGGTHSTAAALNAGLDQGMPGGAHLTQDKLREALSDGAVSPRAVDDAAARVLTSMYAAGIMDAPQPTGAPAANATSAAHAALAQRLAEGADTKRPAEGGDGKTQEHEIRRRGASGAALQTDID